MAIEYKLDGKVAVVTMNQGENAINPSFLESFLRVLDEIENQTDANVLVATSGHHKVFSTGFDLEWMNPLVKKGEKEPIKAFFYKLNELLKRILLYPMPTVAAISGHAFAGGAIMSCAFDFRFMRSDRGFFCFPGVNLGMSFFPGSLAVIKKAMPMHSVTEMVTTGKRITAEECVAKHIVLKAFHIDRLMKEALSFARDLGKDRATVALIKKRLYKDIVTIMDTEDPPIVESGVFYVLKPPRTGSVGVP